MARTLSARQSVSKRLVFENVERPLLLPPGDPPPPGGYSFGMAGYGERPGERPSYRISEDPREIELEKRRLSLLGDLRDRRSARDLEALGLTKGWRCLDVGSGAGTLARWMAERVGPTGSVLATDVDVRFHAEEASNLEVQQHDIVHDELPAASFDLVHARAVLQTIEQREAVLDKLVRAVSPGGWLVVSDPEWSAFEHQALPEPFRKLYEAMMRMAEAANGYDRYWGNRLLAAFQRRGLTEIECRGDTATMHGGTESAEWLLLAYERAVPGLVEAGLLDAATATAGLQAARRPDFLVSGPLSMTCRGRKAQVPEAHSK